MRFKKLNFTHKIKNSNALIKKKRKIYSGNKLLQSAIQKTKSKIIQNAKKTKREKDNFKTGKSQNAKKI